MNFQLNEQQSYQTSVKPSPAASGMAGFLIKKGLAKNATQANLILIGVIVVLVLIMFFALRGGESSSVELNSDIDPATNLPYGTAAPQ